MLYFRTNTINNLCEIITILDTITMSEEKGTDRFIILIASIDEIKILLIVVIQIYSESVRYLEFKIIIILHFKILFSLVFAILRNIPRLYIFKFYFI